MANGDNKLLVKGEWLGKRKFRAKGASGFDVIMDASEASGGESSGNLSGNSLENSFGNLSGISLENSSGNLSGNSLENSSGNLSGISLKNSSGNLPGNSLENSSANLSGSSSENISGNSSGNSPMELLLMSVIGCMGIGVAGVLDKMRKPPKALEIEVEGTRSDEHPKRLTEIKLTFRVQGDMAPERLWRAVQLELEKYCPVVASLNAAVIPIIVLNGSSVTPDR